MAEIYIRTDPTTKVVTFMHKKPFDPIHGLGQTREELLKTGYFVEEYPSPNSTPGMRAVAYYNNETKKINFEYQPLPFSEKTRLDMLENVVSGLLIKYPDVMKAIEEAIPIDDPDYTELNRRRYEHMSRFSEYLAYQIHIGNMSKDEAFDLYPYLQEDIESHLNEWDVIPDDIDGDPDDVDE